MRAAVELDYDRSAAVLDLGCPGPAGFRGWSGGARRSFVIAPDAATPGYLAGELEPGTWQVIIGIHQLPAGGVDYRLAAEVSSGPGELRPEPPPAPPPPLPPGERRRPAAAGPSGRRWLAGDLHTHTVHSDGAQTVAELSRFAAGLGLDFIAVTDHNTVSHHRELPAAAARHGITLLPGQEVTTAGGHAGALGEVGWIDFRLPADAWLGADPRHGGLLSVNHPIAGPSAGRCPMRGRPRWSRSGTGAGWTCAGPRRWPGGWPGTRARSRSAAATGTGRGPTRRPGRRPPGSSAPRTGRARCSTACATGGWPSPAAVTARCCCGWATR